MSLLGLINALLSQSIVRYAIILYVIWLLIILISSLEKDTNVKPLLNWSSNKGLLLITLIYVASTLAIIATGLKGLFPYLNAVFMALAAWFVIKGRDNEVTLLLVLMLILIPYTVVMLYNSYPLGDDVRFTAGFAAAIAQNGRWIPLKYPENYYYQFFDAEPALTLILASMMGTSLKDIPIYYLTLKYGIYMVYALSIYEIVRKLTGNNKAAYLSLLLFSITPPLSLTQIVAQGVSIVLALLTLAVLPRISMGNKVAMYIITTILAISGTIFHATYALVIIAFLLPLILMREPFFNTTAKPVLILTVLISTAYWAFTYADIAVFGIVPSSIASFINFILGISSPYSTAWKPWYGASLSQYLISWALLPAITASIITYVIIKALITRNKKDRLININLVIIGLLGVILTVINFLARQSTDLGGRYFYWLYLLLLPLTAQFLVKRFQGKLIITAIAILIIAFIGIYGIQDPTHSANTFVTGIDWADNYSWKVSWVIAPLLPQGTSVIADARIVTSFFAIGYILNKTILWPQPNKPYLVIIGNDSIGQSFYSINNHGNINIVMDFSKLYTIYYFPSYKVITK
jgi:hypothetical protein